MLAGIHGTLISQFFAEEILFTTSVGQLGEAHRSTAQASFTRWFHGVAGTVGPASSARALWDVGLVPILQLLGYETDEPSAAIKGLLTGNLRAPDVTLSAFVASWNVDIDALWRAARQHRTAYRWCVCFNGQRLRLTDSTRIYADRYVEFDLDVLSTDSRSFAVFWAVLRADVFRKGGGNGGSLFDRFVETSTAHATAVCGSLQRGVLEALSELLTCLVISSRPRRRSRPPSTERLAIAFQDSLTAVYRVLFLLFAEARGLVPVWHPTYRDSYTIEALRVAIERPVKARGLWETLQAIAKLAREGCTAGDLHVTPFNGRLFATVPAIDSVRIMREEAVQRALLALSTTAGGRGGRQRIDYRDLGVEQLGAVYEGVLDYQPAWDPSHALAVRLRKGGRERKATGTFYTPRSITEYVVRRALHPLVRNATPDRVLALRVLDPAMGSAAFLVAACHYLARAYEAALIREGHCAPGDIIDSDRCAFRRAIAQRCLFGVDRNPMAVQLARLSLWLATLARDRPLTFLDHHLRIGNSLIGATPADLARRPPPRSAVARSRAAAQSLPFFEEPDFADALKLVLPDRIRIAAEPGDTLAAVREKERLLEQISNPRGTFERWRAVADLWCACWFWPNPDVGILAPPSRQTFTALADYQLHRVATLPGPIADQLLHVVHGVAQHERFFHWILEFPEAFFDSDGNLLQDPGFDAVIGNPPWDMLRADAGVADARRSAQQQTRFIKDSGAYRAQSSGHVNLYQAFMERGIQLTRRGGRIGIVLPSGVMTDHGAAPIRQLLLHRCQTDSLVVLENRDGVFPIHRSMKFVLLTATSGSQTTEVRCRMGERDPATLDTVDEVSAGSFPVRLSRRFIERVSGAHLAIPEIRSERDAALLERISNRFGSLSHRDGWNVTFGRELNATDDSPHFTTSDSGVPIIEGKQIDPFRIRLDACRRRIPESVLTGRLANPSYRRPRLGYREVASSTNRLTLIAAIVPANVVTTHSVFCLKTLIPAIEQAFLCAIMNSFVANFLIRLFVTTHVTATAISRLWVPRPHVDDPLLQQLARLASRLRRRNATWADDYAQCQAAAARAYELDEEEFAHVLSTFPLVDASERAASLARFKNL